jgi:hypothetical protein
MNDRAIVDALNGLSRRMKRDVTEGYANAMVMGMASVLVYKGRYAPQEAYMFIEKRLPHDMPEGFSMPYNRLYSPQEVFFRVDEGILEPLINGMVSAMSALGLDTNQAIREVHQHCVYAKGAEVCEKANPFS